mmetsp:Transcript_13237/g.22465  ORF Transcript_13237/g.22465 Transcript_13237/m.22465 type:complete len:89 (+) Transcript_13237:638-904(+)
MGIRKVPKCSIKLVLEEKTLKEYYKLILKGYSPPGIGEVVKQALMQSNASFEEVQKASHITTSNGRHYRRVQFKRMVQLVQKQYQSKG